jgi:hypothetical protein
VSIRFRAQNARFTHQQASGQKGLPTLRSLQFQTGRSAQLRRTNIPDLDSIPQSQRVSIGQNRRSVQNLTIYFHQLQGLDQVILAMASKEQSLPAQVSSNGQIHNIAGECLPKGYLIAIAHSETSYAINPQDPRFRHSLLIAIRETRCCKSPNHTGPPTPQGE